MSSTYCPAVPASIVQRGCIMPTATVQGKSVIRMCENDCSLSVLFWATLPPFAPCNLPMGTHMLLSTLHHDHGMTTALWHKVIHFIFTITV